MLELQGIDAGYGRHQVLFDVSMTVQSAAIHALVGANGAGKTTLLRTISGQIRPKRGRISLNGVDIAGVRSAELLRRGLAHVPEGRHLFASLSVQDNLRLGCYSRDRTGGVRGRARGQLDYIYTLMPILASRHQQAAGSLSGGEQQMLAIGRALMSKPTMLLIDEPSAGLAPKVVESIMRTLTNLCEQGMSVLMVEQNAALALQVADQASVLQNGSLVLSERASNLATDDRVRRAYLGKSSGGSDKVPLGEGIISTCDRSPS